jgi:plastocyanin
MTRATSLPQAAALSLLLMACGEETGLPDAGTAFDAGVPSDAGTPLDAGLPDAGGFACAPAFAGCTTFEDRTDNAAERTVRFGGTLGLAFDPKCLRVRAGELVMINGDFTAHPIAAACGPTLPQFSSPAAGAVTALFDSPGLYGYYSLTAGDAAGGGMAGAIDVVP